MKHITITLNEKEYELLKERANREKRSLKSQALYDVVSAIRIDKAYNQHIREEALIS